MVNVVNFKRDVSSHNYFSYYENSLFCDVKLFTGDNKFILAHRIILSEASLFFEKFFRATTVCSLTLPIKYDVLQQIMEFIYKGELIVSLNASSDVYDAFNYLEMKEPDSNGSMLRPNLSHTAGSSSESERIPPNHSMTLEMFNQSQGSVKLDEPDAVSLPLKRKLDEKAVNEAASKSKMAKTDRVEFICEDCGRKYLYQNSLRRHMWNHQEEQED